MRHGSRRWFPFTGLLLATIAIGGCKKDSAPVAAERASEGSGGVTAVAGEVKIDGSSTLYPVSEAVAEEFHKIQPGVRTAVGISGTTGGFRKFCGGEIDIADASRPINQDELAACAKAGVTFLEIAVAYDGLSVVVSKDNDWLTSITLAELKTMWAPEAQGKILKWSDVNPAWPARELHLYGADVDSGTYDYFTEAVVGKARSSRTDYTASKDDNVLVDGVARDPQALGFFGYGYYAENQKKLKVVAVDAGKGPVAPSPETIRKGTYVPLARPLFIYVSRKAIDRPEVAAFVDYYLASAKALAAEVGFIPLPVEAETLVKERAARRTTGTMFKPGMATIGVTVEQLILDETASR